MKTICFIEARMRSSRLPNKVLLPILGRPMLERMIERVRRARTLDGVVIATTDHESCDPIVAMANEIGVLVFRGSEEDVLLRVLGAAQAHGADIIVETTGDCPPQDPALIDKVVADFHMGGADFVSNILPHSTPLGTDVRVFTTAVLDEVNRISQDPADHEHVSLRFMEHPEIYPQRNVVSEFGDDAAGVPAHCRHTRGFCAGERDLRGALPGGSGVHASRRAGAAARASRSGRAQCDDPAEGGAVSAMPLRAALIGCGRIGSLMADDPLLAGDVFTHAEAYVRSPATELVAVCDANPALAQACAARWNVPVAFDSPARLVAVTRPEIVSICTPDHSHHAVVRQLIEQSDSIRAILCEKPLAMTLADGEELVRLADAHGIVLAVLYMRRHAGNLAALRAWLAGGALGRITAVNGSYTKGTLHNGSHWFDLLRMLAGEVAWVEAFDSLGEQGDDPTLDVLLGLAGGGLATLRAAPRECFTVFEMELLLERGRVRITDSGHAITVERAVPSPRYSGYVELTLEPHDFGHRRDQMLYAVEDLAAALTLGRDPACTGRDGVAALRIGTAALKAARDGSRVAVGAGS